jgi:hypothetical protein
MELLLNLLWVSIASGALAAWHLHRVQSSSVGRRRREVPHEFVALGIALLLLFPSISITDDLHAEQAVMEESSRSILKAWQAAQSCLNAGRHATPLRAGLSEASIPSRLPFFAKVALPDITLVPLLLSRPSEGRAPPYPIL